MRSRKLRLTKLRLDGNTQPRAQDDGEIIHEYAELYAAGVKLPPIVVFFDGKDYWVADGFHRWSGAKHAGLKEISCEVQKGSVEDARWFSYSANQTHGVRRTNADKRKAVLASLKHPKGAKLSSRKIAEHVGVSDSFVGKLRETLTANRSQSTTRTGRDGRTIDTSNIGRTTEPDPTATITDAAATQLTGTKVANNKTELKKLAALDEDKQLEVAKKIGDGKAKSVDEAISKLAAPPPPKEPDSDRLFFEGLEVSVREWINNSPVRLTIAVEALDMFLDELRT